MGAEYTPVFLLLIVAIAIGAGMMIASAVLAPNKTTRVKQMPYESGMDPIGDARQRFDVRFYLVAMIFVIFDIEVVFMYPFAVVFRQLGLFGLVEVLVFSVTVFGALLLLVSEGALSWGPVKHLTAGMPSRTSSSTILRINSDSDQAA